jgi:hypothetical protein
MRAYVRAYEGSEPYLFVSYSHKDSELVLPVIWKLYERKIRVWYDEGIALGSEWPHNIETHLMGASAVMVFVSENSLTSKNCENEVTVAEREDKKIIAINLDGVSKHPKLADAYSLENDDRLIHRLTEGGPIGSEFVGDGITGYQYSIDKKSSFNTWNLMLGLAAALAVSVGISLFGLYNGWFDSLLPAAQPAPAATPTPSIAETVAIGDSLIGSIIPVMFTSVEEKAAVYKLLGWEQPYQMTYRDLLDMSRISKLEIGNIPVTNITFATFLPDLETLTLRGSRISDLSPLVNCPKLKTVEVTADMLPLTIPQNRIFEVVVIGE